MALNRVGPCNCLKKHLAFLAYHLDEAFGLAGRFCTGLALFDLPLKPFQDVLLGCTELRVNLGVERAEGRGSFGLFGITEY